MHIKSILIHIYAYRKYFDTYFMHIEKYSDTYFMYIKYILKTGEHHTKMYTAILCYKRIFCSFISYKLKHHPRYVNRLKENEIYPESLLTNHVNKFYNQNYKFD